MRDLLIHVSDVNAPILQPNRGDICFSLNTYMPCFGQFVYLFDKELLEKNFYVEKRQTGGKFGTFYWSGNNPEPKEYRFISQPLGFEYIIHRPIDVDKYAINVITLFSTFRGVLEERLANFVIRKETMNFENRI